ncbi:hypothetical protein BHM03_00039638 [Ensete ventricosum]|nr:hypothetical protein BHM03_00039638 [Ensete ventricosum]
MLTLDWALIILNHTRGQSLFQKKDWLSLKTNHMVAHAKKKRPPGKLQNGRKIEDRVFLHLQPDQQETRALMNLGEGFEVRHATPSLVGTPRGVPHWRSGLTTTKKESCNQMLGQSQVRGIGPGSNDAVGTHQKLAEGIESLSRVHRELAEGIVGLPGVRRKLAEGIRSLLGVRRELAEGDREFARMESGVRRKKTKRLVGRSSGVAEKLVGSQEGLARLDGHIDCN